jgi:hypothetical protein
VGHLHFWDQKYLFEVLEKTGFRVEKRWHKFLQISPQHYISTALTDSIFRNFCDQSLYLCNKR